MASYILDATGLSVTRTFTWPDATGTIALTTGSSSITTVGTITTGTWHGTAIGVTYGGTGADLSGTGGTHQFLKQSTAGAAITVGQPALADLSDSATVALNGDPQFFVPTTGQTISPTATGGNIGCFVNPSGTILALTLTLPTGTAKGQTLYATFTQIVTGLTVTATNVDTKGKVAPTAAAVGDTFGWRWDSVSTKWNRFV